MLTQWLIHSQKTRWNSIIGAFRLRLDRGSWTTVVHGSSNVNSSVFATLTQFVTVSIKFEKLQGVGHTTDNFYGFRYKEWTILYPKIDLIYFPLMSRSPLQKSLSLTHRRERSDGRERLKQRKIIWSYDMIHTIFRIDFKPTHMNQTYTICEISKQMVCGI